MKGRCNCTISSPAATRPLATCHGSGARDALQEESGEQASGAEGDVGLDHHAGGGLLRLLGGAVRGAGGGVGVVGGGGAGSGTRLGDGVRLLSGRGLGSGLGGRGLLGAGGLGGGLRGGRLGGGGGGLGGGLSGGGLVLIIRLGAVVLDDDLLPAAVVAVGVGVLGGSVLAAHVVDDLAVLVVAEGGAVAEVGNAASPLDGALGGVGATGSPGADLDLHGRLGELGTALGLLVGQGADDLAIDGPVDLLVGPDDAVLVELAGGVLDGVETAAVVGAVVTLAEVVGLDLGVVAANPLPVDLVEVVGLEDDGGDDTLAGGGLDLAVKLTEEDVVVGGLGGGLLLVGDGEDGTLGAVVGDLGALEGVEVLVTVALREVDVDALGQSRGGGAPCESTRSVTRPGAASGGGTAYSSHGDRSQCESGRGWWRRRPGPG